MWKDVVCTYLHNTSMFSSLLIKPCSLYRLGIFLNGLLKTRIKSIQSGSLQTKGVVTTRHKSLKGEKCSQLSDRRWTFAPCWMTSVHVVVRLLISYWKRGKSCDWYTLLVFKEVRRESFVTSVLIPLYRVLRYADTF